MSHHVNNTNNHSAISHASLAQDVSRHLGDLFDGLNSSGIGWSLLRPREVLVARDGDIDIIVSPESIASARQVLSKTGYVLISATGRDLHAVAFDKSAGRFLWIHIQSELHIAGRSVPAAVVLANVEQGIVPEPSQDWLLWILLLRALIDKGEFPERYRCRIVQLATQWHRGPAELEAMARDHHLEPYEIVTYAAAGDWDRLMSYVTIGSRSQSSKRSLIGRALSLSVRISRSLYAERMRFGLTVAVIGPDGAGKTTLITALQHTLPLPTRVQYMGLTGGLMPRAESLRVPGLVLGARVTILWARYVRALVHRARGEIVLFDRYTLDGAVPSGIPLSLLARLSRRFQRWVIPNPDLVLLLDASGATMYARKREYNAETLEEWRKAYRRLQEGVPSLHIINAEQPADFVLRQAQAIIWHRFGELQAS